MANVDWRKIKTEYITTDTSYRLLAKKYGIGYKAICARSQKEGWIEAREQHRNKTVTGAIGRIEQKQTERIASIDDLADELMKKIEQAIGELDRQLVKHMTKTKVIEYHNELRPDKPTKEIVQEEEKLLDVESVIDRQGLKQIASALRDLKEVKMLKTELDRREQEARIAKLQKEAAADNTMDGIEITFSAGEEAWNE